MRRPRAQAFLRCRPARTIAARRMRTRANRPGRATERWSCSRERTYALARKLHYAMWTWPRRWLSGARRCASMASRASANAAVKRPQLGQILRGHASLDEYPVWLFNSFEGAQCQQPGIGILAVNDVKNCISLDLALALCGVALRARL